MTQRRTNQSITSFKYYSLQSLLSCLLVLKTQPRNGVHLLRWVSLGVLLRLAASVLLLPLLEHLHGRLDVGYFVRRLRHYRILMRNNFRDVLCLHEYSHLLPKTRLARPSNPRTVNFRYGISCSSSSFSVSSAFA